MERITTTERHHDESRGQIAHRIKEAAWHLHVPGMPGLTEAEALVLADAVLPIIERERVRVVEGLVATIKALPTGTLEPWRSFRDWRDDVLAVVEAAREDTT